MRAILSALLVTMASSALAAPPVNPLIDYAGFATLTNDVAPVRQGRLITLAQFKTMAADPQTLVLDARSAPAFARGHIKGAVNLPFTDFTDEALAAAIGPDKTRRILIYCNNNFTNNRAPVPTKARPLALNIQTFINLIGYGYANVWELGEAVDFNDAKVGWVGGDLDLIRFQ
jgi:phage shock protein E